MYFDCIVTLKHYITKRGGGGGGGGGGGACFAGTSNIKTLSCNKVLPILMYLQLCDPSPLQEFSNNTVGQRGDVHVSKLLVRKVHREPQKET